MFGYVVVNKSEMKFKEFDQYRRYYCGLCRCLKKRHGRGGQMALSYDMTFLTLLLTGLYEPEEQKERKRCVVHPWKKQELLYNSCTEYAADMTALLAYYKAIDDFKDEKKWFRKLYAGSLKKNVGRLEQRYPEKVEKIRRAMQRFSVTEEEFASGFFGGRNDAGAADKEAGGKFSDSGWDGAAACLDTMADAFGQVLSQIFSFSLSERDTIWQDSLEKIGYEIGRFIYVLDAYDDLEQDRKKGCFNPLFFSSLTGKSLDEWIEDVLRGIIAPAAQEFEKLPILKDVGILRNILYSGIWSLFYQAREVRGNRREKQTEKAGRNKEKERKSSSE